MGLKASQETATECEEHARPQGGERLRVFFLCVGLWREKERSVLSKWIRPPGSTVVRSPFHVSCHV